jgi:hypothetical protein
MTMLTVYVGCLKNRVFSIHGEERSNCFPFMVKVFDLNMR